MGGVIILFASKGQLIYLKKGCYFNWAIVILELGFFYSILVSMSLASLDMTLGIYNCAFYMLLYNFCMLSV